VILKKALGIFFIISLFCIGSGMNLAPPSTSIVPTAAIHPATSSGNSDPTQDEWPMFRGQLNHTGTALTTTPYNKATYWTYTSPDINPSSPVVAGGSVFIPFQGNALVDSVASRLYCLDATTGALRWKIIVGWQLSTPAVADGCVYVAGQSGAVYCLDVNTGALRWTYHALYIILSSPAVAGGRVYIGSDDTRVYCLNATTGVHIWNYTTGDNVRSSPAVVDGRVYVGSWDGNFYCLDATTGAHLWDYPTGMVSSSPAVANGLVYVGSSDGTVICLDALTGNHVWDYLTLGGVQSSPAVAGGRVYVGSNDHNVYCLDTLTGERLWNYTTGGVVYSSPAVAGELVYVGGTDNKFYCLDTLTGVCLRNYTTGGVVSSPAVAYGRVYVSSTDQKVYCLPTILDTTPPTYTAVTESADPLELGGTETITISGVGDLAGIQAVLIEFWGGNDTMSPLGGGTWRYAKWTPATTGTQSYTIFIQDNAGNWKATTGSIQVVITSTDTISAYLIPLLIIGAILAASCVISICLLFWAIRTARPRPEEKSLPLGDKGPKDLVRKSKTQRESSENR